jgi:catechol 2,3-dioxygenase-like lactoylglutathione lyase family enzyme
MLGHLGLNVPDLAVAKGYYDAIMPLLDYQEFFTTETECAYMPAAGMRGAYLFFYQANEPPAYSRERAGLQHLAFIVRSRSAVRAVHEKVTGMGSEVLKPPREFPEYPPPYFATFWLDPHDFMLEAVCHHDREE